jgi:hypothetical protein
MQFMRTKLRVMGSLAAEACHQMHSFKACMISSLAGLEVVDAGKASLSVLYQHSQRFQFMTNLQLPAGLEVMGSVAAKA